MRTFIAFVLLLAGCAETLPPDTRLMTCVGRESRLARVEDNVLGTVAVVIPGHTVPESILVRYHDGGLYDCRVTRE